MDSKSPISIVNRKALHDYELIEEHEAGIELFGWEVKSVRNGSCQLKGAHILIRSGEVKIVGMHISPYTFSVDSDVWSKRERKLFLKKNTILRLEQKTQEQGMTLIPARIYTKGNLIKVSVALGKGKKEYDKRETIKKRDMQRAVEKELLGNK